MLKIIEALQTTQNLETYAYKFNDTINIHFTKLNTAGTVLMIQHEINGNIIKNFSGTRHAQAFLF